MTDRLKLLAELRRETGCKTLAGLMDDLQDRGLVSDCAVNIDDVPNSDLMRALVAVKKGGVL